MTSVDTNVLVRILVGDEPKQAAAARAVLTSGPIWIAKTVLLETGWVLRGTYGFGNDAVHDVLTALLGLENVHSEDENCVISALELMEQGIEFADAMHLCSTPPGVRFISFDRKFVRRVHRTGHGAHVELCGD